MPKGPRGEKRPADAIGCAVQVARIATGEEEDAAYVVPKRAKSGREGAKARVDSLSAERRSKIATKAASARWQEREKDMTDTCSDSLHRLLSEGGRELQNIKFLAGNRPSNEGICSEAKRVIANAIGRGMPHEPPETGMAKIKL